MTRPSATGERLARIEALLENAAEGRERDRLERERDRLEQAQFREEITAELKAIRKDAADDVADLAALKNKGVGLLVGVGLLATGAGAAATKLWQTLAGS